MIDAFANWEVLRRHRQRVVRFAGSRKRVDSKHARNEVVFAVRFLDWLHEHNTVLETCTQRHVDEWVSSGPPGRRKAQHFVRWAVKRRLATGIDIRSTPDATPARMMSTEQLTALVRRFVADDTIRLPERVAGLFVMCFGQHLSRVVRLRRSDIEHGDGHDGWVSVTLLFSSRTR